MKEVFIFDTNILIDNPEILLDIPNVVVLIPEPVINELHKRLYLSDIQSKNSQNILKAFNILKNINNCKYISLHKIDFLKSVVGDEATNLGAYVNDDIILAIALQYKEFNPFFITNDKELLKKCYYVGINGINKYQLRKIIKEKLLKKR